MLVWPNSIVEYDRDKWQVKITSPHPQEEKEKIPPPHTHTHYVTSACANHLLWTLKCTSVYRHLSRLVEKFTVNSLFDWRKERRERGGEGKIKKKEATACHIVFPPSFFFGGGGGGGLSSAVADHVYQVYRSVDRDFDFPCIFSCTVSCNHSHTRSPSF